MDIREGMKVRDANGEKMGSVALREADTFIIEKGFFFPKDYTVRDEYVADIRDGEVWLSLTGDELKAGGGYAREGSAREGVRTEGPTRAGTREETRIPVAEEELTAERHRAKTGDVAVRKHVTTEQKTVSVPVTREEVHVERVPADREARAGEADFERGEVRIPVHEEQVEVHKRPVVREEVRVGKTSETHEEQRTGKVRKEQVEVDERGRERELRR
jgi:uncharacterized protein (TIGR02271 family)